MCWLAVLKLSLYSMQSLNYDDSIEHTNSMHLQCVSHNYIHCHNQLQFTNGCPLNEIHALSNAVYKPGAVLCNLCFPVALASY